MNILKSSLFYTDAYKLVEEKIQNFLNEQVAFLSLSTANSPRAVGDAAQDILAENFETIIGSQTGTKYSHSFARRAMADMAFEDKDGFYYVVDVKTHRLDTKFNMPNLTSVERLARFYEDDKNYFVLLMIKYNIQEVRMVVKQVIFVPIEFLDWGCLTIGALGWGQIQIANSNLIAINSAYSRKTWMIQLCDTLFEFYPKEVHKINKRIAHFQKVNEFWQNKPD
jgi:hypothetical protein